MNTAVIGVGRSRLSRHVMATGRELAAGLRRHALLYALATGALVIAFATALYLDRLMDARMALLFSFPILVILGFGIIWSICLETYRLWRSGYEGSPIKAIGRLMATDLLAPSRIANFLHAGIALSLFMSAFTSLKIFLPWLNPFQWDTRLAEWDRVLHLGIHPYQILQPLLGNPYVTKTLSLGYHLWFFVLFAAWAWLGSAKLDSALRQRFLVAFMVTWFLGTNVLGTLFSSVGPAFYGRLLGENDPFMPLMAYLQETSRIMPLRALDTQNMLWDGYVRGAGMIKGISAMPSMHVGTCILLILLGFGSGRNGLGWLAVGYTIIIFLGSIHLAWHYAIDGYAGAVVALFGWYVAGRLVRWDRARQGFADA